ncbi:hypothetical protein DV738_g3845, partial [Chaetothyriales sp. CBS 135597]
MASATPTKQWGLSPPLSTAHPTPLENERTAELVEELKRENNYELEHATKQRMIALSLLQKVTIEFVKEVSRKQHYPESQISQFGGKIFPYGSYRLGVFGPGSDIDTLAVAPKHVRRDDFFEHYPTILRRIAGTDAIQSLTAVPDAFVPIIKLVLNNIEIDLIFVSVQALTTIPKNLNLDDNKLLDGLDQQSIKSITGPRVTDQILALVPEHKTFRTALRAIKLWAQRRAIYANIVGYPGGVAWAMLVAKVCQLYPHAVGATIINKFFHVYKAWNWPTPVMLKEIETGKEKTWNPMLYSGDKKNLMPIITPAYPSMCSTYNMTNSGKKIILKEFDRGAKISDAIFNGTAKWSELFGKHTFFTKDFRYYISVIASAHTPDGAKGFSGMVESKVRILVQELEKISDQISLARPFTKGFRRLHRVTSDAQVAEVRKGSMKYHVEEAKTVDNTSPELVNDVKTTDGLDTSSSEANYFTYTYYIGIDLTSAAQKNLNISGPITFFKELCKTWALYKADTHFIDVQAVKAWELPNDIFEKGELKPPKRQKLESPASASTATATVGGKEVEIDSAICREEFLATVLPKAKPGVQKSIPSRSADISHQSSANYDCNTQQLSNDRHRKPFAQQTAPVPGIKSAYKPPIKPSIKCQQSVVDVPKPRYDPDVRGALVFRRPKELSPGRQIIDVVLDPALGKRLHAHQKEGVQFMYECVSGLRDPNRQGCILADEMGLGKTVQTIALLWTLIKQNPIYKQPPVVKKALIVCPVSVIQNWKREFKKWLSHTNVGVLVFKDPKSTRLKLFDGKVYNVMIIGYERLRTVADELANSHDIDIVVCDEGHRLKTEKNKSARAIQSLNTARRIILSGTPIQNDLTEFYCMVNFVNDGCLGSAKAFVRDFENPIMKSRQPQATADAIEKGQLAADELARTTSSFILRRTADILSNILPKKTEFVLFCKPTAEQAKLYQSIVNSPIFTSSVGLSSTERALQLITILKKLCNSPALLKPKSTADVAVSRSLTSLNEVLDPSLPRLYRNDLSAKIRLLDILLQEIRQTTDEKVVLISSYTSTLNLLANLLNNTGLRYLQLDGSVSSGKRQALVDQFNQSPASQVFAFLLSAKAGGVGINLVGASRVVLFDVDWNPATEDQAIARVHRQGQKRPTFVYRFIVKGTIEEKIWQRQTVKRSLADSILEGGDSGDLLISKKSKGAAFSLEELKDLFRYDDAVGLRTHDLIGCICTRGMTSNAVSRSEQDQIPEIGDIVPASQLNMDGEGLISQSTDSAHVSKRELDCEELMKYSHIDTSLVSSYANGMAELDQVEQRIDDPCLTHLLRQTEEEIASGVAFVFKRVWGI